MYVLRASLLSVDLCTFVFVCLPGTDTGIQRRKVSMYSNVQAKHIDAKPTYANLYVHEQKSTCLHEP